MFHVEYNFLLEIICLIIVGMFIATVPNRNSPPAILLRESYRENGKVKSRTLANLSSCRSMPSMHCDSHSRANNWSP